MRLMDQYLDKGHKLFTDNFYTSPLLYQSLLDRGAYACGTVRPNRKHFPWKLRKKNKLVRPQYQFATDGQFTAGLWHNVTFLSTIHSASIEIVNKRPKGGRDLEPIPCPSAIVECNQFMNAVDQADQQLSYHSLTVRKTVKWWKKLFWRLIDMAILNASIVFRTNHPDKGIRSNTEFRLALIEELVAPILFKSSNDGMFTGGRRPRKESLSLLKET